MDSVDCHNIQHDGGVRKKIVEDTVGDKSRTKIFEFSGYGVKPCRIVASNVVHDINLLIKYKNHYSRQTERVAIL